MHTNFDVERWAFSDNRSAHHSSLLILFIANVLYPLNRLIQRFLNSDMSHRLVGVAPCQCLQLTTAQRL